MTGGSDVALEELIAQLRETLDDHKKVIIAIKLGVDGPYVFFRAIW